DFQKVSELGFSVSAATYNIACGFALLGESEQALTWLEKAIAVGFDRSDLLRSDSDLDSIRGEERFQKILARHGID
ncbi:MAG: hypothetical protein RL885_30010, partial [Planctomycetota bacterium]